MNVFRMFLTAAIILGIATIMVGFSNELDNKSQRSTQILFAATLVAAIIAAGLS